METKFYTGNYSLAIGQPFVIISAEEKETEFIAEKIIILNAYDGKQTLLAYRIKYPKINNRTLNDFILSEIQVCKDDIFHKILFVKYKKQLEKLNFNVIIELTETNSNILSYFREKFPDILDNIKNHTVNGELKALIKLYQSIVIERNDFNIE